MNKQYPVGKAQQIILDALDLAATGSSDADAKFAELGIVVSSKREGRASVPQITVLPREGGSVNASGDGENWSVYRKLNIAEFEAIKQWIIGDVPSDAVEALEPESTVEAELAAYVLPDGTYDLHAIAVAEHPAKPEDEFDISATFAEFFGGGDADMPVSDTPLMAEARKRNEAVYAAEKQTSVAEIESILAVHGKRTEAQWRRLCELNAARLDYGDSGEQVTWSYRLISPWNGAKIEAETLTEEALAKAGL